MANPPPVEPDAGKDPDAGQTDTGYQPLLGVVLFIIPFLLFYLLIQIWPTAVNPDPLSIKSADRRLSAARANLSEVESAVDKAREAQSPFIASGETSIDFTALEEALAEAKAKAKAATDDDAKQVVTAAQTRLTDARKAKEKADQEEENYQAAEDEMGAARAARDRLNAPVLVSHNPAFQHYGPDVLFLLIVMTSAAIGSAIHAARSFALHKANQSFKPKWMWWYLLRFPTGIGMAVLLYLVIRGGLFAGSFADSAKATSSANPYGFAALAALTGMFSAQAAKKLGEIFSVVMGDEERPSSGKKQPPKPEILKATPVKVNATGDDLSVTITGKNFRKTAIVKIANEKRKTKVESQTTLKATLVPKDVKAAGKLSFVVTHEEDKAVPSKEHTIVVEE